MKRTSTKYLLPLLFAGAIACGDDSTSDKEIIEPQINGAADSLRGVQVEGHLLLDEAVEGELDEWAEFHGYRFSTIEGAEFTLEITQKGSSRNFDTTLFLFGQKQFGAWDRLVLDDDDGWGALSKIDNWKSGEYTSFMAVVGGSGERHLGKYRLALTCENGNCIDTTPVDLDPDCDDRVLDVVDSCVDFHLSEADFDFDDPAEEISIDFCVEEGALEELFSFSCVGAANDNELCRVAPDKLQTNIESCRGDLFDLYNIVETADLGRFLGMPQELEELQEELEFSGDSLSFTRLEAYSVLDPGNGIENIAAAVREDYGRVSHLSISDVGKTRDEYRAGRFVPTEIVDQIEAVIGTDYVTAEVGGSYPVAAGADEWVNIHVLYFPGLMATFAIVEVQGED